MSNFQSVDDASQGSPNLGYLQSLQETLSYTALKGLVKVEKISVTASGTSGVTSTNIPVGSEIMDVVVHPTATSGGGTATLSVGGGGAAITDAMACAVEDTIARATTIDQTNKYSVAAGVTVTTNDDADTCDVYVYYKG